MPFPKHLNFKDRLASTDGRFYFQCRKEGHGRLRKVFRTKRDAENFRTEHDAIKHSSLGLNKAQNRITLGRAWKNFIEDMEYLCSQKLRDEKTLVYYRGLQRFVVDGLGESTPLTSISQDDVDKFVRWYRSISETEGARIVKAIKALQTVYRFQLKVPMPVRVPYDRIRPVRRERKNLDRETIQEFISAMPEGSIERAFTTLKILTAMRNVEIADLRVSDVDIPGRKLHYVLRAKSRSNRDHVYPLTDEAITALAPLVRGKRADDRVFTLNGKALRESTLRRRFIKASRKIGITDPPIASIGELRHMAITKIAQALGPYAAQKAVGHASVTTSEIYINREREPDDEMRLAARELRDLVPR